MTSTKHKKANLFLGILGTLGILDTLTFLGNGINLGTFIPGFIGILLMLYLMFKRTSFYKSRNHVMRKIEKGILVAFMIWLVSFIVIIGMMFISSLPDKNQKPNCLIILGAGLKGRNPSIVLLNRLNLAVEYINNHPNVNVIVSGGQGPGETISEAEAMKTYLVSHGIDGSIISKEDKSTSTKENLIFSRNLYERSTGTKLSEASIITSNFHMFRAKFLASKIGIKAHGISAETPYYIYPNVLAREYLAILWTFAASH